MALSFLNPSEQRIADEPHRRRQLVMHYGGLLADCNLRLTLLSSLNFALAAHKNTETFLQWSLCTIPLHDLRRLLPAAKFYP
jgi:hypothetical protein